VRHTASLTGVCCLNLVIWPALRGQDVPVTTLKQTGLFTLPSNPSRISRIVSSGGALWFLVENGNWSELLSTNVAGGNPHQFAIQPLTRRVPFPVSAICANPDGSIAVGRGIGTFEIYSRVGDLMDTIPFEPQASKCVFDRDLWVWSRTGMDQIKGTHAGTHVAPPPDMPKYAGVDLLELADHSVGLLESKEGVWYLLDQRTGTWSRHWLAAPEFQTIRNMPVQDEYTTIPVFISPRAGAKDFYVLSSPIRRREGAKVLRFDSQGNLLARYLCPLPTSVAPPAAMNPDGYLVPESIVVMDRVLLLLSPFQKAVASYSLE
jgi:hypothetical protein